MRLSCGTSLILLHTAVAELTQGICQNGFYSPGQTGRLPVFIIADHLIAAFVQHCIGGQIELSAIGVAKRTGDSMVAPQLSVVIGSIA